MDIPIGITPDKTRELILRELTSIESMLAYLVRQVEREQVAVGSLDSEGEPQ